MSDREFTKVTRQQFDAYPGEKRAAGPSGQVEYLVRSDEQRPMTDRARLLADRFIAVLEEEGLVEEMAKGGLPLASILRDLASAGVAVVDECSPEYARKAVLSYALETAEVTKSAQLWASGAGVSNETIHGRRKAEAGASPRP